MSQSGRGQGSRRRHRGATALRRPEVGEHGAGRISDEHPSSPSAPGSSSGSSDGSLVAQNRRRPRRSHAYG